MVSTRQKRQSNGRFHSQIDDFDQDIIIGNSLSDRHKNSIVNGGTGDQKFTVDNPGSILAADDILVKVKNLEWCFNERVDREKGYIVETVEEWI